MPNSACTSLPAASIGAAADPLDSTDQALIAGCKCGDRLAMGALYRRYQRRVFSLLTRMVGREDAEELAQDVFIRVFRGLARFRGDAALGTWIYRLTMNVSLSFLARRGRRQRVDQRLAQVVPPEAQSTGPTPTNPWLRRQLEVALDELPPGYRAVLVLHDVEGLNHQEIAKILDCRVGTSKSQLHKARMRMRKLLEPALGVVSEEGRR